MIDPKQIRLREHQSFRAVSLATIGANNKAMIGLVNNSPDTVYVWRIWLKNAQNSNVSGIVGVFEVKRIAGVSGQTTLIATTMDTADVLPGTVVPFTGGTVSGEVAGVLAAHRVSTDEWTAGAADADSQQQALANVLPVFQFGLPPGKPLTLYQGQGMMVIERAAGAAGTWDLEIEFTRNP